MAKLDTTAVAQAIKDAVSGVINKDVATLRGFAESQVQDLARQAQLIAAAQAGGHLSEDDLQFFLDDLKGMIEDFAKVIAGLAAIEAEKVWNAAVGVLWDAIGKAIGIALPVP